MYRFWSSGSRGSDKTADATNPLDQDCAKPIAPGATDITLPSPKRQRPASVDTQCAHAPSKRIKTEHAGDLLSPVSVADGDDAAMSRKTSGAEDLERARDVIQYQFGLEILLKHDELRLINQELAKCQVALEQLRRCHLMPYPTHCPTPSQMLEISSGKGPALQANPGQDVPKWAPPFGVVEGPYARHYAKWLIPDPAFDGIQPSVRGPSEASRSRNVQAEGRSTRNSMPDLGAVGKPRSGRGAAQKLQALSSGYPQPKDKQAPCVLKRSDGVTVKLVCIDCQRWDFSSTQGFINHCRIAHKRDFKSHDEAAVHCGHPIEVDESGGIVGDDSKPALAVATVAAPVPAAPLPAGLVHPLVRDQDMSEQHAYKALASRINASLALFHAGKLPGVKEIPMAPTTAPSKLVESSDTPFLAQLMRKKNRGVDLAERVVDAKTKVDWDAAAYHTEDDDDMDPTPAEETHDLLAARTPSGVMRVPARAPPPRQEPSTAPLPSKKSSSSRFSTDGVTPALDFSDLPSIFDDDMMDVDLSPNTMASNNAPSLVSDSSDEEDEAESSSEASDDDEGESDVAEIKVDEDHEAVMHRRSSGSSGKKDEAKHVTFVAALPSGNGKGRRKTQQKGQQKMRVA